MIRRAQSVALFLTTCITALMLSGCSGDTHLSFLDPQGPIAEAQRWHFFEALAVLLVFVALPVFVLTAWFLWRYRHGATSVKYTPKWNYSGFLEFTSWFGPVVIVLLLSYIVWHDAQKLDPFKPLPLASNQSALRIQVIGYDWKWLFVYPDQGIASIGLLALPAGRPIAMQLTSATVMQSLHIPALGSQIYAMGGMVTQLNLQADKPGRSLGENNMYNGDGFHQQRFTTKAMTPERFNAWVSDVRLTGTTLDAQTLNVISLPSTRAQLIAALGQTEPADGNIYFKGVAAGLFSKVVIDTMGGVIPMPSHSMSQPTSTAPLELKLAAPVNESASVSATATEGMQ